MRVLDGRFGPYVTDGTINATVPRGVQPEEIDLEQGIELLREREARGPVEKRPRKTAKKSTNKSTKRTGKRTPPQRTTTHVVKKGTSKKAKAAAKRAARTRAGPDACGADARRLVGAVVPSVGRSLYPDLPS